MNEQNKKRDRFYAPSNNPRSMSSPKFLIKDAGLVALLAPLLREEERQDRRKAALRGWETRRRRRGQ